MPYVDPMVFVTVFAVASLLPVAIYRLLDLGLRGSVMERLNGSYRVHLGSLSLLGTVLLVIGGLGAAGVEIVHPVGLTVLVLFSVLLAVLEETKRLPTQFAISFRVMIGAAAFFLGFGFTPATTLSTLPIWATTPIDLAVTILFYVGVLYTITLLDNLRGLASGIVVIVAVTLMSLMLEWGAGGAALLMPLTIAGICLGHLVLLGNDRHLQLGSVGQVLAGVLLAATTVSSRTWGATLTMLFVPLIAISLPLAERLFSVVVRLRSGETHHAPAHLHSLLVSLGVKDRWVVLLFWVLTLHVAVLVHLVYVSGSLALALAVVGTLGLLVAVPAMLVLCLGDAQDGPEEGHHRILFLSHYFYPEVNAPASRLYEHARRWQRAGHHVTVVCPVPSAPHGWPYKGYRNALWTEETIEGIRVIRIWTFIAANKGKIRRTLNYVSYMMMSLLALAFIRRHDVIVATSPQFFCGLAGAVATLFRRERFILEVRDIWPESIAAVGAGRKKLLLDAVGAVAKWMYSRAHHIVTVGDGYRDKLLEIGATRSECITVIPNGIDFERFEPNPEQGEALFREWGLSGRFVVSYVGTVGMAHGLGVILDAGARLKETRPEVALLVVGDGAERQSLQAEAESRGLDNVIFAGLRPKEEIAGILGASSATFVHLRKTELFRTVLPSKMFEGMALARPIILGVRGSAEELLERAEAGLVVEPEDAVAFCGAVEALIADPGLARRLGENGRRVVNEEFNRDQLAVVYTETVARVLAEPDYRRRSSRRNVLTSMVVREAGAGE